MLSSFYIRNFRSIIELRLDFSFAEGKAPNGHKSLEVMPFLEAEDGRRMVPCLAFFGANATGKSNLLKAYGTLQQLVRDGGGLADLFDPNKLHPRFDDTTLELQFIVGRHAFSYRITYSHASISEERLLKDGDLVFEVHGLTPKFSGAILSPAYPHEKLADILRVECSDGEGRQTKPFLHRIGKDYPGLHPDLRTVHGHIVDSVKFFGNDGPLLLPLAVKILAETMDGDQGAALREITDMVRRADIDISSIIITETQLGPEDPPQRGTITKHDRETGSRHAVSIGVTHMDVGGNPVLLNFLKHESAGTQRLAGLVGLILYALKTGGVFLVDELDCSLHPLLMREIVLLFKRRRSNPRGAQLVFTTHNTDILDESILRLSEIALVRKTPANGTMVRRLVDVRDDGDDIRNVTNFRRQYLAGFYAGVPHPAL